MAGLGRRLSSLGWSIKGMVRRMIWTGAPLWPYQVLVTCVGLFHLVEVHVLDPAATGVVKGLWGGSLVLFAGLEAPVYHAIGELWTPGQVAGTTSYYLFAFVGLLVYTPYLVALTGDRGRLKRVLLTYPVIYGLALPGYLLVPQLNPYVSLGLADPFSALAPGLEAGYYLFTTVDNTVPSLHVAYTVALSVRLARAWPAPWRQLALLNGGLLVSTVVYLRVHWLGDVAAGLLVAWFGLWLSDRIASGRGPLAGLVARLDRWGWDGVAWALRRRGRG